jgi:hypothetical protein
MLLVLSAPEGPTAIATPHLKTLSSQLYQSTRAEGMAGTGLGIVTQGGAVFLNPALIGGGLQEQQAGGLQGLSFPGLSVESTPDSVTAAGQALGSVDEVDFASVLDGLEGRHGIHFRQQMFPNIVFGRLLFGVLQTAVMDVQSYQLERPAPSAFASDGSVGAFERAADVFARSDLLAIFGFSVPMGKRASLGVGARYGLRTTAVGTAEVGSGAERESADKISSEAVVAKGYGVDAGIVMLLSQKNGLSLSLVARNIGDTAFEAMDAGDGQKVEQDLADFDVGLSWAPVFRRTPLSPALSVEVHDLARSDLELSHKLALGAEIGFGNRYSKAPLALRAGHNLLGPSYGFSLDLFLFQVEAAAYTQAVHLPEGADQDVRTETRYIIRTSWDLAP